jgi:GNAT superfamily N-acetyltransferase
VKDFEFRPGTPGDANAISTLARELSVPFLANPEGVGAELFWASIAAPAQAERLAGCNHDYLLAFRGETLAGFIGIRDNCHIFHLFITEPFQRLGLARTLWEKMLVRHAGQNPGYWTVNSSRDAVPVYQRFGFVADDDIRVMHGVRFLPMKRKYSPGG